MKRIIVFIAVVISFFSTAATAQTADKGTVTEKIEVAGNCGMCKERIENAAYGKGVKHAQWDKATGILTVTYRADKTSREEITRRIADAGHEIPGLPASKAAYEKLPACCAYKTNPDRH